MSRKLSNSKWDVWAIKAELRRRGFTAKKLAEDSGFSKASVYVALARPVSGVNKYIAGVLGVPVHELWPDWFEDDGDLIPARTRKKIKQKRQQSASHNLAA